MDVSFTHEMGVKSEKITPIGVRNVPSKWEEELDRQKTYASDSEVCGNAA
jgi:hypothetical protein